MTKFIVIAGKKQSGKDTLASQMKDYIDDEGYNSKIISFADPLKKMCHDIFGIPLGWMYGSDEDKQRLTAIRWDGFSIGIRQKYDITDTWVPDENDHFRNKRIRIPRTGHMTVREVLQVIGTDIFRERIWSDVWAAAPFNAQHEEDFIIIPDCRFPNEVRYANQFGMLVRIKRDTGLSDNHASETALDNTPDSAFDKVYYNAGTLDDLSTFAYETVEDLLS